MQRILSFTNSTDSIASLDGEVRLINPLQMNANRLKGIRLVSFSMSSFIPNVYNYGGVNTGLVRCSKDDGATWDTIQLTNGVYTIPLIQQAILSAITTYWTDSSDPGFALRYNSATYQVYCDIDSTKLAVADQFQIDFKPTGSQMYELLGFTTTTLFDTDGLHTSDNYAQLDWFGNQVSVQVYGLGNLTILNGSPSNEFFSVPLSASKVNNEYVYPIAGIRTPMILIDGRDNLQKFSVKLVGSRNDRQVVFLEGQVKLVFELREL